MIRKVRDKISGWGSRLLSFGGKLVLIRNVLSAMPLHLFHVIRPPTAVFNTLEKLLTRFLWGSSGLSRKIHWCKWSSICFPVAEGGLDIRLLEDVVKAFELKLWWRLRAQNSLWASFMLSKYCKAIHPSRVPFRYPASPLWRHLCSIRDEADQYIRWKVNSGDRSFWFDCWMDSSPLSMAFPDLASMQTISFYWQGATWDRGKLLQCLPLSVVDQISSIPIGDAGPDLIRWSESEDGNFSLNSAWRLVRQTRQSHSILSSIWQKYIPSRVSFFIWRLLYGH